jgi:tetratricopeptide (TPR) repeat protein
MSIHLSRAEELLQQSRIEPAITELQQHLSTDPDDPLAHALMARAEAGRSNRKEAFKWADRAVHLGPDRGYCQYIRAWVLDRFDKPKEAEQAALEALRLEPFRADYYGLLGQIRLHKAEWQGALEAAEAGLRVHAAHVGCINVRAMALMRLGRKDIADSAIQGALAQNPEDAVSHTNQGWICLNRGQRERAVEHFREALRLDPSIESARHGLLEALRTKYLLYRALYSFYDWMSRFNVGIRRGILIGLYVLTRIIYDAGSKYPAFEPVAVPITILYVLFVFLTWTGRATFDIFLRFHPLGRLALSRSQKNASNWVALCIGSGLVSLALVLVWSLSTLVVAGLCFAIYAIPTSQIGRYKGDLRKVNLAGAAVYAVILGLDVTGVVLRTDPEWLISCLTGLIVVFAIFSWISAAARR